MPATITESEVLAVARGQHW